MKNLKLKTVYVILIAFITLTSCKRESIMLEEIINNPEKSKNITESTFLKFVAGESNAEVLRLFNDLKGCENSISIIDNPNQGDFSPDQALDIYLSGRTEQNVSLKLNGVLYSNENSWLKQGLEFKNYFGTDVASEIKYNNIVLDKRTMYYPKAILGKVVSFNKTIKRVGNNLTWNVDSKNLSKKVVFYYRAFGEDEKIIKAGVRILQDNGSFSFDEYIKNKEVKKIYFSLIRGNGFSTLVNEKKTSFTILCTDHHNYTIKE